MWARVGFVAWISQSGHRSTHNTKHNTKRLLFKIRLHLGPYLVAHADKQGKGFGFLQSACTLEELYLIRPMGPRGQPLERSVVVHYLTMSVVVCAGGLIFVVFAVRSLLSNRYLIDS